MTELKPCPFCGGKARLFVGNGVRVICSKCYAGTRILTDNMEYESNAVEMVVEAWNRRADAAEKVAGIFKVPMADLVDIFSEIPAADVAPVVHCHSERYACRRCRAGGAWAVDFVGRSRKLCSLTRQARVLCLPRCGASACKWV